MTGYHLDRAYLVWIQQKPERKFQSSCAPTPRLESKHDLDLGLDLNSRLDQVLQVDLDLTTPG